MELGEPDGDRSADGPIRAVVNTSAVLGQLFAQLGHHRDLADVVEPDGRVVQPEPSGWA